MNKKQIFASVMLSSIMGLSVAMPVFAQGTSDSGTPNFDKATIRANMKTCLKTAQEKRKLSLSTAHQNFKTTERAAMVTWKAAMVASKLLEAGPDERKAALKSAQESFRTTVKTANKTRKSEEKSVKQLFRSETKACKTAK